MYLRGLVSILFVVCCLYFLHQQWYEVMYPILLTLPLSPEHKRRFFPLLFPFPLPLVFFSNVVLLYIYCFVLVFLLGQNLVRDPFSWDITGRNIMMLIIQGFVFFFFTVLIEYRFFLPKRFASCLSLWYFRSVLYEVWSCCDYRATAADYHASESHLFLETCNEWLKPRQTLPLFNLFP